MVTETLFPDEVKSGCRWPVRALTRSADGKGFGEDWRLPLERTSRGSRQGSEKQCLFSIHARHSNLLASVVTRKHFERLVARAVRDIPKHFRDEMTNVAVVVEDRPSSELLKEMEISPPDTLYGLYQGTPLPEREWTHGNVLPDRITIYQQPIVGDSDNDDDVIRTIGETVIHEFGHYFGLSEDEIEEIESRYWRRDAGTADT